MYQNSHPDFQNLQNQLENFQRTKNLLVGSRTPRGFQTDENGDC